MTMVLCGEFITKLEFFQDCFIAWIKTLPFLVIYSHDVWHNSVPGQLALSSVERLDPHVWANPEGDGDSMGMV